MSDKTWYALEVVVDPKDEDLAAAVLWDYPMTGLEQGPRGAGHWIGFSADPWPIPEIEAAMSRLPSGAGRLRSFEVEDEDWLAVWKRSWRPTPLGRTLLVVPAWWTGDLDPSRKVIRIEPGRAFGTGTHETTILAWEMLETALLETDPVGWLLDVGTGTGVLALGAVATAGGLRAVATEADEQAVSSFVPNWRAHDRGTRVHPLQARSLPCRDGCIRIAVANLTAAEHEVVDRDLIRVLAPAADLVLSGFLLDQIDPALARFRRRGFREVGRRVRGTWIAAYLRRNG